MNKVLKVGGLAGVIIGGVLVISYVNWATSSKDSMGQDQQISNAEFWNIDDAKYKNSTSTAANQRNLGIQNNGVKKIATLTVGSTVLDLEIADTDAERVQGLSNRKSLPSDIGLLFIFDGLDKWGIWMKDMNFPIDIIWLDENYKVTGIKENARPESYPNVFTPKYLSKFVLETNVGFIKDNNIKVGTQLVYNK